MAEEEWEKIVFSDLEEREKKIVEKYRPYLLEIVDKLCGYEGMENIAFWKAHKDIMQPFDLEDLERTLEVQSRLGHLKEPTEKDKKEIEDKLAFLEDRKNRKVYEKYTEKLRKIPKAMLLCPSSGFYDYLRRFQDYFPAEEELTP